MYDVKKAKNEGTDYAILYEYDEIALPQFTGIRYHNHMATRSRRG